MVAYWNQQLYLEDRVVLMGRSVVSQPARLALADPAEMNSRRQVITAILFS